MGALSRAKWRPLIVGGGWNPELRRAFDRKSGAYAVREKNSGRVLYVGESHTDRGWKTLTRHFQDASGKFAAVRETFVHSRPGELEGALWPTRKGQPALDAQAELITRFRREGHELVNVDDGRAATEALRTSGRDRRLAAYGAPSSTPVRDVSNEEEDFFGSFAENPPPKLVDVPLERRADARTPDLFTGRTRLEEGAKGRKDWKGEAERTARELAECRRQKDSSVEEKKPSVPRPPPPPVQFDERGQGTMFSKRNPKRPTYPQARKALLDYLASRGWTVTTYAQGHTLKIPYATIEPTNQPPIRIWLHAQSIHRQQTMGAFDHARARSTSWDMREPPEVLERLLLGRPAEAAPRVLPPRIETTAEDRGRVLRLVEAGRAHSLPIAALSRPDLVAAAQLESEGLLRRMPARGTWPPRFVVTAGGSHHLGTFASDDDNFRADSSYANEEARRARLEREGKDRAARELAQRVYRSSKPAGYGVEERAKKTRGQLRMFNPARLVTLGYLVSIAYRDASGRRRVLSWGARGAPIVAYDPTKKTGALVLIFAPAVVGRGSAEGAKEYKRTHWGQAGEGNRLAGDRLLGKAPKLGPALEITYATRKGGDSELVNYWHTFGDFGTFGGKRHFIPPAVVAATVGGRQLVRLEGGTYTVKGHGIVG